MRVNFDALGQRSEVIAPVAAALGPHPLAGRSGKRPDRLRCDGGALSFYRALGPRNVSMGLIAGGLQFGNAVLQHLIGEIGDAVLNGVVEPLELGVCLGRPFTQFGDVGRLALGTLLAAVENRGQDFLEPGRLQKPLLDVIGHESVELLHGDRAALAAGLPLAGLGRAGVVPIPATLAGAQRHRHAAGGAEADAGEQRRPADDARRGQRRTAGLEQHLDGLELGHTDDRWNGHFDDFGVRLALPRLPELGAKAVPADISRARQHLMHGVDAPAPAVTGADTGGVEMLGDRLDTHRPRGSVTFPRQTEDQPHGLGLEGIDLQGLLRAVAALLARDGAVTDRRQRAVPEALAGVLLHGPQGVLGVLLRLVLVEQRHDLADHVAHRIVTQLLGNRHQPDAVLGEPADVELQLELVAEEAAKAVHHDHVEHRRLGRAGVDHALEFRSPVVGGRGARLDKVSDDFPAA